MLRDEVAKDPRKISFFRDEWPFQDERILINQYIYIYYICIPGARHNYSICQGASFVTVLLAFDQIPEEPTFEDPREVWNSEGRPGDLHVG